MGTIDRHIQAMRRTGKFTRDGSGFCELCGTDLVFHGMKEMGEVHVNHIYSPGMLFVCNCGKSQMWTNAVRDLDALTKFVRGELPQGYYMQGFCNDKFCPVDGGFLVPIRNGFKSKWVSGELFDLMGCSKGYDGDKHNQSIVYNFLAELGPDEDDQLIPIVAQALGLV